MDNASLSLSLAILACLCVYSVWGTIGSSAINCYEGNEQTVGSIPEGYEGVVETLTNIQPTDELVLEPSHFPIGVTFLKLNFVPGETTASVETTKALDADALTESDGELHYSVTCKNSAAKNRRVLMVMDINDNAPVFEQKSYQATVSEREDVGFNVLRVLAVDADVSIANNQLTYSILPPHPNELELRSDGSIALIKRLNYNAVNHYSFTVQAKDPGDLSDQATVSITVTDFDNMNPYFDHGLYQASIPENEAGPFSSITPDAVKAQDGDTGLNQPVVYSITAVNPNKYVNSFIIDRNSGVITVVQVLDREEIENLLVHIQAAQQDDSTKTASAVVFVTVEDDDDNVPEFDQSKYTAVIPENSPNGLFVLQVQVTDLDKGGFMGTLQVIPDTVPFSISPAGDIRVKTSADLDREATSSFVFQVEAKEKPPSTNRAVANVSVSLSDENDNSPVFERSRYEGKVSTDQTIGMLIVKVEATDQDEGLNGQISYFIDFGNEEGYFDMDELTGFITLNKTIHLLENSILQFTLYVTAKDGGEVSRYSSVLVDIKAPGESRPQFLQKTYQGKVLEGQEAGTEIVKAAFLSVTPAVPITLTIETEADKFSIDEVTGMLRTIVKLDYETRKNYTVQLSLSDGTNGDEASVYVEVLDINDNSPVFPSSPVSVEVPEDAAIGHNVTTVTATDADSGLNGEVLYSLEGSAGIFSMDPKTGLITVAAALDRETQDKYEMRAVARDQGRPSLSAETSVVVTVTDINDNAPRFSNPQYEASVSEKSTVGTAVITINATDEDEGPSGNVTYHITKQEPSSLPEAFTVNATSGRISLAQQLDYSKAKRYTLGVEGRDGGSPALTGSAVVTIWVEDVNDKPPKFSQDRYDVGVYENIAPGSALVSLDVTDEDEDGFRNGHFLLSSDTFSINSQGVVYLRSNVSLDRETRDRYIIQVMAVDQPTNGLNSTAHINLTVLDVNDNNPQFLTLPSPLEIPEDRTGEVYRIQASDLDIGKNGEVGLFTSSHSDVFSLTLDGTLMVTGELDRETRDIYDLVIIAEDNGLPSRTNVTMVTVTVTDVNDNAPVFNQRSYLTRFLAKDVKGGDLVLTVSATDSDAGNNSVVTYRFLSISDLVDLNSETGDITWTQDLTDMKDDLDIDLIVIAEDHGIPPQNDKANVTIQIRTALQSDSLAFENSTYYFSIKENQPMGTPVGEVKVSTGSQLVQVAYKLTSHTDLFSIDQRGAITTLKILNKEEQEWFAITVEATDTRTPPNATMTTVVVQVEDVNEPPVFESEKYTAAIFSVVPFRFPIVAVKAVDPDVGDSSELHYSLLGSNLLLDVESSSGQVYVLDLTGAGGKVLQGQVKATDKDGLFSTADIEVEVKESTSDNIVVIMLNQPVYTVEKKIPETQSSLQKVLGWSVNIITVRLDSGQDVRSLTREAAARTSISFIAVDAHGVVMSAEEVNEKLQSERESVKAELEKVFGPGLELQGPQGSRTSEDNNETAVIALSVLLALSIIGLIVVVVVPMIRFRRTKDIGETDKTKLFPTINSDSTEKDNQHSNGTAGPREPDNKKSQTSAV